MPFALERSRSSCLRFSSAISAGTVPKAPSSSPAVSQMAYGVSSSCNSYFLCWKVQPLALLDVSAIDRPAIRLIRELFPTPLSPKTTMFLEVLLVGCCRELSTFQKEEEIKGGTNG